MTAKKKKKGKITFSGDEDTVRPTFKGFCSTMLIIAVILMTAVAIGVRLEAGRGMVENRLKVMAGLPVTIEKASIGFPYVLVLDGVSTEGFEPGKSAGFRIEQVRAGLSLDGRMNVKLTGGSLYLEQDEDERWFPTAFARMGDLPLKNIAEISRLTSDMRDRVRLSIKDGNIKWKSRAGAGALAGKIDFEMSRIKMPRQVMYYYYISVLNVMGADGVKMHDVEREWLASDASGYMEIARSEDKMHRTAASFWEGSDAAEGKRVDRKKSPEGPREEKKR